MQSKCAIVKLQKGIQKRILWHFRILNCGMRCSKTTALGSWLEEICCCEYEGESERGFDIWCIDSGFTPHYIPVRGLCLPSALIEIEHSFVTNKQHKHNSIPGHSSPRLQYNDRVWWAYGSFNTLVKLLCERHCTTMFRWTGTGWVIQSL